VGTLKEGKSFGEIAVLQDCARTASIQAVSDCVLLSLDREHFSLLHALAPQAIAEFEIRLLKEQTPLEAVLYNPEGFQGFAAFCQDSKSSDYVHCWEACRQYKELCHRSPTKQDVSALLDLSTHDDRDLFRSRAFAFFSTMLSQYADSPEDFQVNILLETLGSVSDANTQLSSSLSKIMSENAAVAAVKNETKSQDAADSFAREQAAIEEAQKVEKVRQERRSKAVAEKQRVEAKAVEERKLETTSFTTVQMKTFHRWVNSHLATKNLSILNLETGFSDGLMLIELLMILSNKKMRGYAKKPKMLIQKLENITKALEFMKSAAIRLVNIGPADINSGNMTAILGLVWALILRYQINQKSLKGKAVVMTKDSMKAWAMKFGSNSELTKQNFINTFQDSRIYAGLLNSIEPGVVDTTSLQDERIV
jgi:hypothetical protein